VGPHPGAVERRLRAALLTAARFVGRSENQQLLALLAQLAALTDAVTRLRESQKRAAQAAAARHAAEQLHLIGAQHASAHAGPPVTTTTQVRRSQVSVDPGQTRPGPTPGPPGSNRGLRR
jgi:hypothetical protein